MLLSMCSCHVLWQSFSKRQARCLSTMSTMPRVTTTPRRLHSDAHRRSLPQRVGVSPTAIKKLRVEAHPAVGITPGQESTMLVAPTHHHQNGRGDVHAAPHLNQICHHPGTDITSSYTSSSSSSSSSSRRHRRLRRRHCSRRR